MEGHGAKSSRLLEGLRQDVLAGVLLGLVRPAGVVDPAGNLGPNWWRLAVEHVLNRVTGVDDVDNLRLVEPTHVVGLPA
jgi:hypothetical protein